MEKLIVTIAPTGNVPTRELTPHVPVAPREIADDIVGCYAEGASICHIHARDEAGKPTHLRRYFAEIFRLLDETGCPDVIDAAGKWVVPGFIDVHTHYDAEVLLDPGLRESVRHGVTTVLLGSCSLSTVYAEPEDAADLFSRVEAVPRKFVLDALQSRKTWSTPAEYVRALEELPLGPNVSSMLGHSDLRTAVLGLDRATTDGVVPTEAELEQMAALLDQGLDAGMLGMSGMDAPIDKLDGDRFRSRALPSTFATWRERRRLIKVLRKRGRILQSAPNVAKLQEALNFFLESSGWFGRRPGVRMSLLVAAALLAFVHLRESRQRPLKSAITWVVAAVVILASAATTVQVYRIGDSGARSAWGDKVAESSEG